MAEQVLTDRLTRPAVGAGTSERFGAWAGLLFTATFVTYLALALATGPRFTDPISDVREYLGTSAGSLRIAGFIVSVGTLSFFLPFISSLAGLLGGGHPGGRWWTDFMRSAAIVSVVAFLMSVTAGLAVSLLDVGSVSDVALQAVWNADAVLILLIVHLTIGLWVAAAGMAILRSSALPRWLGWFGLVLAAPQLAAASWAIGGDVTAFHDAAGGIGQIGAWVVWIPATAIAMLRHHD